MLVLRRKVNEAIVLDGRIEVKVLAVEGERVKIGITAPSDVPIFRAELLKDQEMPQVSSSPTQV
jgi:carbon storage regulator